MDRLPTRYRKATNRLPTSKFIEIDYNLAQIYVFLKPLEGLSLAAEVTRPSGDSSPVPHTYETSFTTKAIFGAKQDADAGERSEDQAGQHAVLLSCSCFEMAEMYGFTVRGEMNQK